MEEAFFTLKDNRKLAYAVYGPPGGLPILYFHGTPSSRREPLLLPLYGVDLAQLLIEKNCRLIVPDRGSQSTHPAGRTFLSFADDTASLLHYLNIRRLPVLCWSGGGPYGLAAAWRFPALVSGVYIIAGITRPFNRTVVKAMGLNKWYFKAGHNFPWLLHAALRLLRLRNKLSLPMRGLTGLPPVDYTLLKPHINAVAELTVKEAIRKGTGAAVNEAQMYFHPFGFSIGDITQPIHFWWGTNDRAVVALNAKEVEEKAIHPVMHYHKGEGHLSLFLNDFGEVLDTIVNETTGSLLTNDKK